MNASNFGSGGIGVRRAGVLGGSGSPLIDATILHDLAPLLPFRMFRWSSNGRWLRHIVDKRHLEFDVSLVMPCSLHETADRPIPIVAP
jgi:hypothetical protein